MRLSSSFVRFYAARSRVLLAILFVGFLSVPTSVRAQVAGGSGGVWWSASVGVGGARLTCDLPCDVTRDGGPALEVSVGTYATPAVRVGLDGGAWTFRDGDFRETIYTAGVTAEIHPWPGRGLHLIGGLGWTGYRANDVDADEDDLGFHYNAARLRLGAGWDFPLTGAWTVGNRLTIDASSLGTLSDQGQPVASSVGLSLVRFGIYLRYR